MSNSQNIPFLDLASLHQELEDELVPVFQKALRTAAFIGGPMVEEFEREFARFCQAAHCIGVSSGTDAVRFALMAAGVQPGDVVVSVPHTFIATTEAISQAGARPDFVDIDESNYCMDPVKLRQYLEQDCYRDSETGKLFDKKWNEPVTAVVPIHLYGQTADMDPILELADRYRLLVIEDACQAHGAEYFSKRENRWRKAGSMGHAAAFSFYPGKNLGACGEAGAVTTNDAALAKKVQMLRDHGQGKKYYHEIEGYNGRLDSIQAGILRVKLSHLPTWNEKRRNIAKNYHEMFSDLGVDIQLPEESSSARSVYHLYVIRVANREQLRAHLADAQIDTGIHYPIPVHLQKAYAHLGFGPGDFPVSEAVASEIISLPIFPQLTLNQQQRVVEEISKFSTVQSLREDQSHTLPASAD
ncbi:MAG TPA: DegT/DnrJ/EryC1/StrS family aminotransferase [Candidatus Acidoferrales bacterium]|nr:DegT/DnrJ/EryC1/StrS family aminotransferase [Candidatus Acidoferrales bacterium]